MTRPSGRLWKRSGFDLVSIMQRILKYFIHRVDRGNDPRLIMQIILNKDRVSIMKLTHGTSALALFFGLALSAHADENLLGYVGGAETLPDGAWEVYQFVTLRDSKAIGEYQAIDTKTEIEYGVTDAFDASFALNTLSIDTSGIRIDGYLPLDENFTLKPSGLELGGKYNFLRPAADGVGLSVKTELHYSWIDPHSGQDKDTISGELTLLLQRYFLEGQLVAVANFGGEATYAERAPIENLPADFEWPTDPEMEIELKAGAGMSYRFAPSWFIGAEALYETEFETEVGQERWSLFVGPSIHYGGKKFWITGTWFPQIDGGGERYEGQTEDLHLIEKTEQEFRLKLGINF